MGRIWGGGEGGYIFAFFNNLSFLNWSHGLF